ncbi:Putative Holin-X, holin superfamily III [Reichenbachiella agariperforans]|uniref:Putative Holin-X, holin superfamily III n=1 Tax=Reichenbachiella agariperforans TaxID=156994 RepID=A0A1M6RYE9_REIAG|nr:phage holin family protein [Reichenbachiella agariperforans]SHK37562.1 Putative Holin-X, holin superfamily III [Reichenbachiella agariperforans]
MFNINKLKEAFADYLKVKIELFKLDMSQHISRVVAQVIAYSIIVLTALVVLFFISMGLAYLLNEQFQSSYLGFMVVAGAYALILSVVFYFLKSGKLESFFEEKMISSFDKNDQHDEE